MRLDPEENVLLEKKFPRKEMLEDIRFLLNELTKAERYQDDTSIDLLKIKYLSV